MTPFEGLVRIKGGGGGGSGCKVRENMEPCLYMNYLCMRKTEIRIMCV